MWGVPENGLPLSLLLTLVFGFSILIPYTRPAIGKVRNVRQLLIMTTSVEFAFQVGFIQAAVCVGLLKYGAGQSLGDSTAKGGQA